MGEAGETGKDYDKLERSLGRGRKGERWVGEVAGSPLAGATPFHALPAPPRLLAPSRDPKALRWQAVLLAPLQAGGLQVTSSQVRHLVLHQGGYLLQAAGQLHLLGHGVLLQGTDDLVIIPVDVAVELLQSF